MSPMSPRLLRPRATGFDPAAQVYFNAVAVADGQQLEPAVKKAINDFIVGCKRDGIWSSIKASCILMGARTLSGALVPLVGTAPTNNGPFVSGDYDRKTGLVGNASTKYLNTNRNNNADPQDNQHLALYSSVASTLGPSIWAGVTGANGRTAISMSGGYNFRSRTQLNYVSGAAAVGFVGVSRSASGSYSYRDNGSSGTRTQASLTPDNQNIGIFADGIGTFPSAPRIAFYSIGESLDLALLDARVSALYTAIGAAIP